MGNWFGRSSVSASSSKSSVSSNNGLTSTDSAILNVKRSRDKLLVYRQRLVRLCDDDTERARNVLLTNSPTREQQARLILRRRKYHLLQRERLDGALANMEAVISQI